MISAFPAAPGIDVISSSAALPGMGTLAINAFVVHGAEPVLVDTGTVAESDEFLSVLRTVIDPAQLRWVFLTHTDFDHIGALPRLLADNPALRVITSFFGVGIMGLSATPLPMDRVHLLNPGQRLTIGDRTLRAVKPPTWDNGITCGVLDESSGALFSADCFGALLPGEVPQSAAEVDPAQLQAGQRLWVTVDSPWIHTVERSSFLAELAAYGAIEPDLLLSAHLPPAPGAMLGGLLDTLATAPDAPRFVPPDQEALNQVLRQLAGPVPVAG